MFRSYKLGSLSDSKLKQGQCSSGLYNPTFELTLPSALS